MSAFDFSKWPPPLTDIQLATLTHHATTYALAHGLTYLPPTPSRPPSPSSAIHAPISLLPAPVPRDLFQKAQRLQSIYNTLYARVAVDDGFLDQVMGAEVGAGQADEFVRRLWQGWKEIREEGIVQVHGSLRPVKPSRSKTLSSPCISVSFAQIISSILAVRAIRSVLNKWNLTRYHPHLVHSPIGSVQCTGVGHHDVHQS